VSRQLVQEYFNELARLRKFSGQVTENVIRAAFRDMLKAWSRQKGLQFLDEYAFQSPQKTTIRPDGTIKHDLRLDFGYWEAKDTDDDLDEEISKKLRKGYPQTNIIFENSDTAVLIQNRQEVLRCSMLDEKALLRLLELFFSFERQEIYDFRRAVEQFKADLPAVLEALREKIDAAYAQNDRFRAAASSFLQHAKDTINPVLGEADVREMLIQHILTEEIFTHVFNEGDFHRENNIAKKLYELEGAFFTGAVKKDTLKALETYYAAIRSTAAQIRDHSEKQKFLKVIYEGFYKVYNPKAADRLGVVYTPNEIVRFMIEGADWLCQKPFGKGLIDPDVEILDPATGTGTFICELLEFFRGQPDKLARKYREELHANEVAILPYYVANLNIEATYAAITGQYAEFPSLCFVDTLDNVSPLGIRSGHQHELFAAVSEENVARVRRQKLRTISVVIGNPPYNPRQECYDQGNANRAYERIDQRIKETYIRLGTAQNKNTVYDMYARFFRWASDRLEHDGIVAFITNRNFTAKAAFDGFRRAVAAEFADIYVLDLGGDVRENPRLSGTKHNVFGIQTGVAIAFMVRRRGKQSAVVRYARRPEMETAEDKLAFVAKNPLSAVQFETIVPSKSAEWLNSAANAWDDLLPLCSKQVKAGKGRHESAIFRLFSLGNASHRDSWVYDFSREDLQRKVAFFIDAYEAVRKRPDDPLRNSIRWDRELDKYRASGIQKRFEPTAIVRAAYRPFIATWLYFDRHLNGMTYQLPDMFPPGADNTVISFSSIGARADYCVSSFDGPVDLHYGAAADGYQLVSRYRYNSEGQRIDNITGWAENKFRAQYGKAVTKDDIFAYVYAVLHDPVYRETYAINLKREFPRIPFYPDFRRWVDWGSRLLELHVGYGAVEPWPLERLETPDPRARDAGISPKVVLKADKDKGIIRLDTETQLSAIPPEVWDYKLGNRSGVEWILDQYKEKTPRDPTIREKFNTYRFADYKKEVIDLILRVTRVSVETVAITETMKTARRDLSPSQNPPA